ncbi:putative Multiple chloroplast division site 1 [Quillaja saponaria]|uniref:Multiple chloroplast division site 1 n=1 Tax=Quillaja saponaria TaxID=32244 RepID=A0AAD7M1G5_QUISA|nr:putative Multiple chloroplast division site 1 [Quillaja saponaria]
MATVWTLRFHSVSLRPRKCSNVMEFGNEFRNGQLKWVRVAKNRNFSMKAIEGTVNSGEEQSGEDVMVNGESDSMDSNDPNSKFQQIICSIHPAVYKVKRFYTGSKFAIWLCAATAFLIIAVRVYVVRKSRYSRPGSVADLVRRGQLRSDRRGISRPLKYEDPFNNPLVKVEQQAVHQKRRSRAYQWKRPTIFLKEGDSIPPDVDPDTVRWIPANHPFATTASDMDENLAQNNVYQKHGVPFRIQAEHEALQRKLEALQNEQKLNKLVIDPINAKDFERPFKSHVLSHDHAEKSSSNNQVVDSQSRISDCAPNFPENDLSSEERQNS